MSQHSRYAVYYMPRPSALATFGAQWLGWDAQAARECVQPEIEGMADLTRGPQKYGFHGTLKAPFRLAAGCSVEGLREAVASLAACTAGARSEGLTLTQLGRWFALTPTGEGDDIARVAATCVTALDGFRALPTEAEMAKRRKGVLNAAQEAHLQRWGYPYVLDQFRFHLTLTGSAARARAGAIEAAIRAHLPDLPTPFLVEDICLCGERADGRFELLERFALTG
ncbi:DUF1045 domain-containing protein [Sagittula sp. S175]|uniref:DUF1045 domain-containing protein n=1 Tax=Sagittula sp. S175 TaxID=3415129 RepID=UPI003C7EB7D9